MAVVTLTGHLGSMGSIATEVAAELRYTLADRELLLEAADSLGWSEEEVAAFDERTRGQGGRLASFLRRWAENTPVTDMGPSELGALAASTYADAASRAEIGPRDRRYIDVLSELVRSLAERGDAVVVGRGGQVILAGRDDTVHVRVVCALEERVRRIAERDGMSLDAARARIQDSDRERARWHHKYFGADYESPYLYHMVINATRVSDKVAADVVVQLVKARLPLKEPGPERQVAARGKQDWGWVEMVEPESFDVRARAHLFATEIAPNGAWYGQLESIHLMPGRPPLRSGSYFARFPLSGMDHTVRLEIRDGITRVESTDLDVPAIFRERSGG